MYDNKFVSDVFEGLSENGIIENAYSFDIAKVDEKSIGTDMGAVPVKLLIDFSGDITNEDIQEQITKFCLRKRRVTFYVSYGKRSLKKGSDKEDPEYDVTYSDPVELETIMFNSPEINWDVFPIFSQHPLALKSLIQVCTAQQLKNLFPLQN